MEKIRLLQADEIECRVQTVRSTGCSLLLYKTARVDMAILDEVFGPMNWKRTHELIGDRLYCNIDVWDSEKKEWVRKQDVGTESNTEAEKGQASDAFKRAGFNIGIGRELYTAPFIWVSLAPEEIIEKNKIKVSFSLQKIEYDNNRNISKLIIVDNKGNVRYTYGEKAPAARKQTRTASPAPQAEAQPVPAEPEWGGFSQSALRRKLEEFENNDALGDFYNNSLGGNTNAPEWVKVEVRRRMNIINRLSKEVQAS